MARETQKAVARRQCQFVDVEGRRCRKLADTQMKVFESDRMGGACFQVQVCKQHSIRGTHEELIDELLDVGLMAKKGEPQ